MAVNNSKKVIARAYEDFGHFLEPFAILLTLIIIALPILAVINLTAQAPATNNSSAKAINTPSLPNGNDNQDVLGATDKPVNYTVELVSGKHNTIQSEVLMSLSQGRYAYSAIISPFNSGTISKPILTITNSGDTTLTGKVILSNYDGSSYVSMIYKDSKQYVSTPKYGAELFEFTVDPNSAEQLYISIYDREDINFDSSVELEIVVTD